MREAYERGASAGSAMSRGGGSSQSSHASRMRLLQQASDLLVLACGQLLARVRRERSSDTLRCGMPLGAHFYSCGCCLDCWLLTWIRRCLALVRAARRSVDDGSNCRRWLLR